MEKVKIGIIGIGGMGTGHAKRIIAGEVKNLELTAVCDVSEARRDWATKELKDVKVFDDYKALIDSGEVDLILVATPHYVHPEISMYGFEKNVHVISEKPAGVYTKQVIEMNEASKKTDKIFGIMYNQRTNPLYRKLKEMIEDGKLGELKRMVWIITDWYRTQSYYNGGSWRGTWDGEGGGVLLNQCPHNLDLWQWIFGMPKTITGFTYIAKYHDIEVEDEVTAYAEYENGATATFITTTGEYPGTNRLEVTGDRGKVVIEGGKMTFWELSVPEREFCYTTPGGFDKPKMTTYEISTTEVETAHNGILQNVTNAILNGEKLIAPGVEGVRGLEISNAIYLSSWTGKAVTLPIDGDLYLEMLTEKRKTTKYKEVEAKVEDLSNTYGNR